MCGGRLHSDTADSLSRTADGQTRQPAAVKSQVDGRPSEIVGQDTVDGGAGRSIGRRITKKQLSETAKVPIPFP
ncbi:hypothetical protein V6667_01950 [Neisseria leonii]|uniref:Uncharacterized protein n=1 Tax=Neisseria leonii TaxID=2995413 RepID=A0A9X4E0R4_9NEIS|nr:hypothetical protein [Neisseria sp. 51.81]MDD9327380.1 hypothetical protein [Neisseria sp. 51.81]